MFVIRISTDTLFLFTSVLVILSSLWASASGVTSHIASDWLVGTVVTTVFIWCSKDKPNLLSFSEVYVKILSYSKIKGYSYQFHIIWDVLMEVNIMWIEMKLNSLNCEPKKFYSINFQERIM